MAELPNWSRFDELADRYDKYFLTTRNPARRLVELASPKEGGQVLEIGCGTGFATFQLADRVTVSGEILAIDISEKMMNVGREKARAMGVSNVHFRAMDGAQLDLADSSFDLVISVHALFGFDNIPKAIGEWRRVLRDDGKVAFSSFSHDHKPVLQVPKVAEVISSYMTPPPDDRLPLDTQAECRSTLQRAGFREINISTEELGFHYQSFDEFWNDISSTTFRLRLNSLEEQSRRSLRSDLEATLQSEFSESGLLNPVTTILSIAHA